jgi:translation initiation factor IF-2
MPRNPKRKLSKKEQKAIDKNVLLPIKQTAKEEKIEKKKTVLLPEVVSVKDFADKTNLPVTKIITELMKNGVLANINQTIDFDTAAIIGDELNLNIEKEQIGEEKSEIEVKESLSKEANLKTRPPIVTILGHVDHGKTSLLDYIRKAHVASGESGGITQHISAYQITLEKLKATKIKHRTITFIDTPGHAAFSAMREHGAAITDIAVIIVAANDGVKPQTIEVIKSAQGSNVPIIIAINKVDLPEADVMKTKQQLAEYELVPEEWGGKTVMVEVSAKTGKGVDDLLEMILLQADMMDLKADESSKAVGVVIESQMQKGKGAVAMVLVENGTLNQGDAVAIGASFGRARILENFKGENIKSALPSTPVRIAGLKSSPEFGDKLVVFDSEKEAKEAASKNLTTLPSVQMATAKRMSEDGEDNSEILEYRVILKADVKGSLEAIKKSLSEIRSTDINLKIISEGIGAISESDITLAKASRTTVIGFRVKVLGAARKIAETENIKLKTFDIIYELIDHIRFEMAEMLPPEIIEEELASGTVLAIFRDDRKGFVAGGKVESGVISLNDKIKFYQNENEKYRATVLSLRKEKGEAKEVNSGSECGFGLPPFSKVSVGDKWVAFKTIEKKRSL